MHLSRVFFVWDENQRLCCGGLRQFTLKPHSIYIQAIFLIGTFIHGSAASATPHFAGSAAIVRLIVSTLKGEKICVKKFQVRFHNFTLHGRYDNRRL